MCYSDIPLRSIFVVLITNALLFFLASRDLVFVALGYVIYDFYLNC